MGLKVLTEFEFFSIAKTFVPAPVVTMTQSHLFPKLLPVILF